MAQNQPPSNAHNPIILMGGGHAIEHATLLDVIGHHVS
jgi:hypothetical protein